MYVNDVLINLGIDLRSNTVIYLSCARNSNKKVLGLFRWKLQAA